MLEAFPTSRQELRTYRFGNVIDVTRFPDVDRLDSRQLRELTELLGDRLLTLAGFLDQPFTRLPLDGSRFTDGSFSVYYSALERDTAHIEAHDYFRKLVLDGATTFRVAYYRCISCHFAGRVIDLRSSGFEWLTTISGENECRSAAREARANSIDGFLTPSAAMVRRSREGSCLPVFNRAPLSDARDDGGEKFTFEPMR
jgi:hypothetical protein